MNISHPEIFATTHILLPSKKSNNFPMTSLTTLPSGEKIPLVQILFYTTN
jgi:hypothetical protein